MCGLCGKRRGRGRRASTCAFLRAGRRAKDERQSQASKRAKMLSISSKSSTSFPYHKSSPAALPFLAGTSVGCLASMLQPLQQASATTCLPFFGRARGSSDRRSTSLPPTTSPLHHSATHAHHTTLTHTTGIGGWPAPATRLLCPQTPMKKLLRRPARARSSSSSSSRRRSRRSSPSPC